MRGVGAFIPHLERLEQMLASRVFPAFVHNRVRREVREPVVWLVLVIEEDSGWRRGEGARGRSSIDGRWRICPGVCGDCGQRFPGATWTRVLKGPGTEGSAMTEVTRRRRGKSWGCAAV